MRPTCPLLAALLALAGCTAGPNYAGPPRILPAGAAFVRAQGIERPAPAPTAAAWWRTLHDPILDDLIVQGLTANPDVDAARAKLRQARAVLRRERANALPSGNASALYLHGELPPTNLGSIGSANQDEPSAAPGRTALDFYNLGFDASWEVDLFGGKRRTREAAAATAGAEAARLADVQVTLSAEIAQTYVNLRDRQARLRLLTTEIDLARRLVTLTQRRVGGGTAVGLDLIAPRRNVEVAQSNAIALQAERDAYLNALAILAGRMPGSLDPLLSTPATVPLPPAELAVGEPSALIARRPDIRAAERVLATENARIGVAEAARFPKLTFNGLIGIGGSDPGNLLDPGNLTAIAIPRLAWNILDFGRNKAQVDQAHGLRDEAEARYRGTVLAALRDAEDALVRFGAARATVAGAARQKKLSDEATAILLRRYEGGTVRITDLLDARRQGAAAEQQLVQATAAMTADYIAIQKALGFGWQATTGT